MTSNLQNMEYDASDSTFLPHSRQTLLNKEQKGQGRARRNLTQVARRLIWLCGSRCQGTAETVVTQYENITIYTEPTVSGVSPEEEEAEEEIEENSREGDNSAHLLKNKLYKVNGWEGDTLTHHLNPIFDGDIRGLTERRCVKREDLEDGEICGCDHCTRRLSSDLEVCLSSSPSSDEYLSGLDEVD